MFNLQNTKLAATGLFAGTLALGILIGIALDRTLLLPAPPLMEMRQPQSRHDPGDFFMRHFSERLDLTPAQQADLDRVLSNYRQRFSALRQNMHPRFSAMRDSLDQHIAAILTPAQREKFETLKKEKPRHQWERRREDRERR